MSAKEDLDLGARYFRAAEVARSDGIRSGNEVALLNWIRRNVRYDAKNEFYLFLGIGSALADLEAQAEGYANQAERAYKLAKKKSKTVTRPNILRPSWF
jgi:hypothetical protein